MINSPASTIQHLSCLLLYSTAAPHRMCPHSCREAVNFVFCFCIQQLLAQFDTSEMLAHYVCWKYWVFECIWRVTSLYQLVITWSNHPFNHAFQPRIYTVHPSHYHAKSYPCKLFVTSWPWGLLFLFRLLFSYIFVSIFFFSKRSPDRP